MRRSSLWVVLALSVTTFACAKAPTGAPKPNDARSSIGVTVDAPPPPTVVLPAPSTPPEVAVSLATASRKVKPQAAANQVRRAKSTSHKVTGIVKAKVTAPASAAPAVNDFDLHPYEGIANKATAAHDDLDQHPYDG